MTEKHGDLISRTEVLQLIENIKCDDRSPKNYGTLLDIMRQLRYDVACAYDVDKVVKQLEGRKAHFDSMLDKCMNGEAVDVGYWRDVKSYDDAIDIVKSGWTKAGEE